MKSIMMMSTTIMSMMKKREVLMLDLDLKKKVCIGKPRSLNLMRQ